MNKIDTTNWGEFKIGDLFDIHPTKAYKETNSFLFEEDGKNPVVVNSSYNNGIGGYTNKATTEKAGIITFSDTTSATSIFYQPKDFVGYAHVQGLYPIGVYKNSWNKESLLFFLTIFKKKAFNLGFDYVNKFTRESAKNMKIKLPITKSGKPDFVYMENHIKTNNPIVNTSLTTLLSAKADKIKINTKEWKRFHLYDNELFIIDSGSKLDKSKMSENNPTINFVGRSGINNGITTFIDEIKSLKPYKEGNLTISLGGEYLGSCFVQHKPFYTSQNVNVLIPTWNMPYYCKLFICAMVFKESRLKYKAFVDELNRHMKTDFSILLPIKEDGKIDWEYMEIYMKNIETNTLNILNNLKGV